MSYLVLARKHRPATFDQVVGQEHVTGTLAGAIESQRVAHAFCFTGPRGVGKTSVARILAKSLNCEHGPTPTPCGKCVHCVEIDQGRAVDVQEIDAASNSRVEDVRELREMIRFRPQSARTRVTILDEVHMLSKAAFNALLKTLEEPPEHAVFILATTDVHKVPLTILSRCQRYDFRRLPPRTLAEHLANVCQTEGFSLPTESLALLAREADGSIRDSLSLLDQVLSVGRTEMTHQEVVSLLGLVDRELVHQAAQAVMAAQPGRVLELVSDVYAAGGEMQAFYNALMEHFRNLAAAKSAPPGADIFGLTVEELTELAQQARQVSAETLHEIFEHLAASEELFRRASQPRLVMEMTLLKLTQVRPVLSLNDIIARLGQGVGDETPQTGGGPAPQAQTPQGTPPQSTQAGDAGNVAMQRQTAAPEPAPQAAPAPKPGIEPAQPAQRAQSTTPLELDPTEALKELADFVSRGEIVLGSYLRRAVAENDKGTLVINMPPGPAEQYCNSGTENRLSGVAFDLWNSAPLIKLRPGKAPEQAKGGNGRDVQERVKDLAEHPAVQAAMEVFEAEVVALNPDSGTDNNP